jgi:hypothetical protein
MLPLPGHDPHGGVRQGSDVGGDVDAVEAAQQRADLLEAARIFAHGADQGGLRAEMTEKRRLVDAGAFGNFTGGGAACAVAFEYLPRCS